MEHLIESIAYLKRVSLDMEWDGRRAPFEFIYGIGTGGLSPFEVHLSGQKAGHEHAFSLNRKELDGFFQHLAAPLFLYDVPETFTLKVRVVHIAQADQREVIKAMAEASSCGSHCCGH
jgi:hypothetical protein